jgi:hypothetical protein
MLPGPAYTKTIAEKPEIRLKQILQNPKYSTGAVEVGARNVAVRAHLSAPGYGDVRVSGSTPSELAEGFGNYRSIARSASGFQKAPRLRRLCFYLIMQIAEQQNK